MIDSEQTGRDRSAQEWCDKYSSTGDFEEYGQKEAFLAGWKAHKKESDALYDACVRLKFVINGGMPRPPMTADTIADIFIAAVELYQKTISAPNESK